MAYRAPAGTNQHRNKQTNKPQRQTNKQLFRVCTVHDSSCPADASPDNFSISDGSSFPTLLYTVAPTLLNNVASTLPLCCSAALLYTVEPCCLHYPTQCCWINILLVHGDWWIHTQWCTLKGHFTNQCLCRSSINSVLCSSIHASPDSAAL